MRRACPCGSTLPRAECCGPVLAGVEAASPEALMRSRYTAFVEHDEEHLLRSWHESTRPPSVDFDPDLRWTGLEVLAATGPTVEFRASYEQRGRSGAVHERSRFVRSQAGWQYVRGRLIDETSP